MDEQTDTLLIPKEILGRPVQTQLHTENCTQYVQKQKEFRGILNNTTNKMSFKESILGTQRHDVIETQFSVNT